jgi:hypothetical protein
MAIKSYFLDKRVLKDPTINAVVLSELQNSLNLKEYIKAVIDDANTELTSINVDTINESTAAHGVIVDGVTLKDGGITLANAGNLIFNTSTGTKFGTATSQKLAFWNATPVVQPTTAITTATNVGGAGTTIKIDDTFGGYTVGQVVAALQAVGILA